MDSAAESKHLEFHVDRSGDQNVVLDLFSRVLFVFLDQAHSDVGKQVVLQSVEFKFEHFADPIVIMIIYWCMTSASILMMLASFVKKETKYVRPAFYILIIRNILRIYNFEG